MWSRSLRCGRLWNSEALWLWTWTLLPNLNLYLQLRIVVIGVVEKGVITLMTASSILQQISLRFLRRERRKKLAVKVFRVESTHIFAPCAIDTINHIRNWKLSIVPAHSLEVGNSSYTLDFRTLLVLFFSFGIFAAAVVADREHFISFDRTTHWIIHVQNVCTIVVHDRLVPETTNNVKAQLMTVV